MKVAQKKSVWNFTLFFIYTGVHLARCEVQLTHNSASALADTFICGGNTQFTCSINSNISIVSWVKDSSSLKDCPVGTEHCANFTKDNYQFTSNVTVKEYFLTVNPVNFSNAGTFTCNIGASVQASKTISIAVVPSILNITEENGTGTIKLKATTECAFPMLNVSIKWYYLQELTDTPKLYNDNGFSPVRTEDNSTCTSGDCTSGAGVSKVVSTVTFHEKESGGTSAYLQAEMVHSAAPSSSPAVVATTTNKYIIIEGEPPGTSEGDKNDIIGSVVSVAVGGGGAVVAGYIIQRFGLFLNKVWYVFLTLDRSCILGATIGACVVTAVTRGGPADGKLKVGFQIHKIDGKSLTGKDQNEIEAMIKDKTILTLHVSKVGSTDTSEVKLNCKRGEQLGFDCENLAIVTAVNEGGKAYKKLKKGDRILSINGKSTTGKSFENINEQLNNPPTVMELTLKRGNDKKHVTLDFKGKASSGIAIKKEKEDIVVSKIEPAISGKIQEQDCILSVNGVSTAGMKDADIIEMLKFSIILKVTKDVTLKELDPDHNGSFGVETFPTNSTRGPANMVDTVTHDGPAQRHGIKHGDTIVSINGKNTKGKSHQEIEAMLKTFGTSISLEIKKGDTGGPVAIE